MKKRALSLLLALCMVLSLIPAFSLSAMAADTQFSGGDGSEENPYRISTPEQLDEVRNNLTADYILVNDIDLSTWGGWSPIGENDDSVYGGTFDGNNYCIKNLVINASDETCTGLFGKANGEIKNLTIASGSITARNVSYVGAIVGYISNSHKYDQTSIGKISNCTSDVSITVTSTSVGRTLVGGIAGYAGDMQLIENCVNNGDITCLSSTDIYKEYSVGGVFGQASLPYRPITLCMNTGDINVQTSWKAYAGGVFGDPTIAQIDQCSNLGDVCVTAEDDTSANAYAGGIAGKDTLGISNCYNVGTVTASSATLNPKAPASGYLHVSDAYAGGIVSSSNSNANITDVPIENCYNTGLVSSRATAAASGTNVRINQYAGAIIGGDTVQRGTFLAMNIINCYYLDNMPAADGSGNSVAISHTSSDMQSEEFVVALNTVEGVTLDDAIWGKDVNNINNGYPILSNIQYTDGSDKPIDNPDALELISSSPTAGTTYIKTDTLTLTFNQDINLNIYYPAGTIYIKDYDDDSIVFEATTSYIGKSVSGATMTLQYALSGLDSFKKYYVYIDPDCIWAENLNSEGQLVTFAGITDKDTLSFSLDNTDRIYQYLLNNKPNILLAKYDFIGNYLSDVRGWEVFAYGAKNRAEVVKAFLHGLFSDGTTADKYMNDSEKVKAILRDVVNEICNNEDFEYFSSNENAVIELLCKALDYNIQSEEAENAWEWLKDEFTIKEAEDIWEWLKRGFKTDEEARKWVADYSININYLLSIQSSIGSDTVLYKTIDDLLYAYTLPINESINSWMKEEITDVPNKIIDLFMDKPSKLLTATVDAVLGAVPSLEGMDKVISISTIQFEALDSLRIISEKIRSGEYTDSDIETYRHLFTLCQGLKTMEYTVMLTKYDSDNEEYEYLQDELASLKKMTYDNIIPAKSYSGKSEKRLFGIWCPVDVDIADSNGTIVAQFIDNIPTYYNGGEEDLTLFAIEDAKFVIADANEKYTLNFTATANGVMEYYVLDFDIISGMIDSKTFQSVTLATGKQMTSRSGDDITASETRLYIESGNKTIGEIYEDGSEDIYSQSSGGSGSSGSSAIKINSSVGGKVTVDKTNPKSGEKVTITVIPDTGYRLDTLKVTNAAGKELKHTDDGDDTFTVVSGGSKLTITVTFKKIENELPFTDANKSDWFYDAVKYVYENGLFSGTSATTFSPNTPMSRAMMVTVLCRLDGATTSGKNIFTDVPNGTWYTDAVSWAATNAIVTGIGNNLFDPDADITREQMAAILYRYCEYKGIELPKTRTGGSFADASNISAWATESVDAMYAAEILSGKGNGILDPQGNATRAEVAQMFTNFMESIE